VGGLAMKKKSSIFGVLVAAVILILLINNLKSFDNEAQAAYEGLEKDFINKVPVNQMNAKAMSWIHDTGLDMERNPDSYSDREKFIVDNLRTMMVRVGTMNSLDYRDRILEEEYYDARDSVLQALEN
jgi:hypothetical protein